MWSSITQKFKRLNKIEVATIVISILASVALLCLLYIPEQTVQSSVDMDPFDTNAVTASETDDEIEDEQTEEEIAAKKKEDEEKAVAEEAEKNKMAKAAALAAEKEAKKKEEEEAAQKKAEEESAKKKAEEQAAKIKAEEEAAVEKKAKEEAEKKKVAEEAALAAEEAAAQKKADEAAEKKKAEEEAEIGNDDDGKPLQGVDARSFYAISSTDGKLGRNNHGDLIDGEGNVEEAGIRDTNNYFQTLPVGHPFYVSKTSSGEQTWGILQKGQTWRKHCKKHFGRFEYPIENNPTGVLVVENGKTLLLQSNVTVKGLVVRKGGKVFICSREGSTTDVTIRCEFILIESGGLLQAGAETAPFDADTRLKFIMVSTPHGRAKQGVVASSYSYKWYCPGVDLEAETEGQKSFTGLSGGQMEFRNIFHARAVAVGFAGTLALYGALSAADKIVYQGTWEGTKNDEKHIGPEHFLTVGAPDLPTEYAVTWAPLLSGKDDGGNATQNFITLDLPVDDNDYLSTWRQGCKVCLSFVPGNYTTADTQPGNLAMPPMWYDYDVDTANYTANLKALDMEGIRREGGEGMEIATVDRVENNKVYFKNNLVFNRYAKGLNGWTTIKKGEDELSVRTVAHAGLLTRNICFAPEFTHAPLSGGANNRPSTAPQVDENDIEFVFRGPGDMSKCVGDYDFQYDSQDPEYETVAVKAYDERNACLNLSDKEAATEKWQQCRLWHKTGNGALDDSTQYTYPQDIEPKGSWVVGTEGLKGANAMLGAHCMFRLGSYVDLNGVEMHKMGLPGNNGQVAQYATHWHLAGFAKHFRAYMPKGIKDGDDEMGYCRRGRLANCSFWQTPSRVLTVHGTAELEVSNNVTCWNYGSTWFLQEGTETDNTFDHNLSLATIPCRKNMYDNPSHLFSFAGFDANNPSTFWLKNNRNSVSRNVVACCPRPVVAVWLVNQKIGLSGAASTTMIGDEIRKLPAFASQECAAGGSAQRSLSSRALVKAPNKKCYTTDELVYLGLSESASGCKAFANTNQNVAAYNLADNVVYGVSGFVTNYVAMESVPPHTKDLETKWNKTWGLARKLRKAAGTFRGPDLAQFGGGTVGLQSEGTTLSDAPVFIPYSGPNGTSDRICTDIYGQPTFPTRSEMGYSPWLDNDVRLFDGQIDEEGNEQGGGCCSSPNGCSVGNTQGIESCSRSIPFVLSSNLVFANSSVVAQTHGAVWLKAQATWSINNCFLSRGTNLVRLTSAEDTRTSTAMTATVGTGLSEYDRALIIQHNFICDGGIVLLPNPTVYMGEKTFLADSVSLVQAEYVRNKDNPTLTNDIYCDKSIFPESWFAENRTNNPIIIYDSITRKKTLITKNESEIENWEIPAPTLKSPFVCEVLDGKGQLLQYKPVSDSEAEKRNQIYIAKNPTWSLPIASVCGTFTHKKAIDIGNNISEIIALTVPGSKTAKR